MSAKEFYAHIAQDGRTQTVLEHLRGTAQRSSACLMEMGLERAAYLAGLLHDLGKFTEAFQSYLREGNHSKRGSVIHTFQGCKYVLELDSNNFEQDPAAKAYTSELLAFAIGAHHGLFDCIDDAGKSGLQYRRTKENIFYQEAIDGLNRQGISRNEINHLFRQASEEIDRIIRQIDETYKDDEEYCFEIGLLARLLLSAVIEGDRHDTAAFMNLRFSRFCG